MGATRETRLGRVLSVLAASALTAAMVGVIAAVAGAATCQATNGATSYSDLQLAITNANSGDTIQVQGVCEGNFTIDKDLTLTSWPEGSQAILENQYIPDYGSGGTTVGVPNGVRATVKDLVITESATGGSGVGIGNAGNLTLAGTTWVTGFTGDDQGGVGIGNRGTLVLNDYAYVSDNRPGMHAHACPGINNYEDAVLILNDHAGAFDDDGICNGQGADFGGGSVTLNDYAEASGIGSYSGFLRHLTVTLNGHATVRGIYNDDEHGIVTLNDSSSVTGSAYSGVWNIGTLTLNGSSSVSGNLHGGIENGGTIYNTPGGTVTLNDSSSVTGNSATLGGGIYNFGGIVYLTGSSSVSGNSAATNGGGIFNSGIVTLKGSSSVTGNTAGSSGGGIFTDAALSIKACTNGPSAWTGAISPNAPNDAPSPTPISCSSGSNLLTNPGFESGLTGWTAGTLVTSPVHSGTKGLRIVSRSTAAQTSTQTVAITAGATYQASGWLSVADVAAGANIQVVWLSSTGTVLRKDIVGTLTGTAGLTQKTGAFTAPTGATQARFVCRIETESDNAGQAWYDDLSLGSASTDTGTAPDYVVEGLTLSPTNPIGNVGQLVAFQATVRNVGTSASTSSSAIRLRLDVNNDGSFEITPGNQNVGRLYPGVAEGVTWSNAWVAVTGTHKLEVCADVGSEISESNETNNCTSLTFTLQGSQPPPSANLLQNPGFESGLTGWTAGTVVTSPVHSGTKALRISAKSSAAQTSTQTVTVTAGATYQASGWLSVSGIAAGANIQVIWLTGSGTVLRKDIVGTLTGTAGFTQETGSFTAPTGATKARFVCRIETESDNAGQAWYDDLSFGKT